MLEKYNRLINTISEQWQLPSLSVGMILNNEVNIVPVSHFASHLDTGVLTYRIGSLTKAFTATALGILIDDRLLNWRDPVVNYLPQFAVADGTLTAMIKVEDLLSHSTGLSGGIDSLLACLGYSSQQIINKLKLLPINAGYREKFQYTNGMYLVAGQLIKEITGENWDNFLHHKLLTPLNMKSTSTNHKEFLAKKNRVCNDDATINFVDNLAAAGSINSCVTDLISWIKFNLDT
jgi:CubicO group peptidase (beta-lactamase class C family)